MTKFATAMDTAQSMVTRMLHGDRETVGDELVEMDALAMTELAIVTLDLVCYVHHRWATTLGMGAEERNQAWAELMLDVAAWREGVGL